MSPPATPLGIIAGGGELPALLARTVLGAGRPAFVLAVDGFAGPLAPGLPHRRVPFGALGRAFDELRRQGCQEIVFAGRFSRPGPGVRFAPDFTALRVLWRNWGFLRRGDDAVHRVLVSAFNRAGFTVISPLAAAPELAAPRGTLTARLAPAAWAETFPAALARARSHGATDRGQAIVVMADGRVAAEEGREGTDAMLAGLGRSAEGGLLVKVMKPAQIETVDPPAIGVATVERAASAGLAGILIEAGRTLIIDRDAVRRTADSSGLFLVATSEPAAL